MIIHVLYDEEHHYGIDDDYDDQINCAQFV
jgi:hypothetical protein